MRVSTCPVSDLPVKFPDLGVSSYQRASVWSPGQKAALIRSVLADYPTGSIVLNDLSLAARAGATKVLGHLRSSHDIIDGQQRLTTLYEFMDEPMLYVLDWAKNPPRGPGLPETLAIQEVRAQFDTLRKTLRSSRAGYVPKGTKTRSIKAKIAKDANDQLRALLEAGTAPDPQFYALVDALGRFKKAVGRKKLVIEELTSIGTTEAETIFHLINTSGTELLWWELLWSRPAFVHEQYCSTGPYRTRRDNDVRTLSILYRNNPKLKTFAGGTSDSFWHSMLSLGEYIQARLAVRDPLVLTGLLSKRDRRLPVDGLGFRLVSTALTHDIGRAAIFTLFDQYGKDAVRAAVDTLFDTADLLLKTPDSSTPDFLFFKKYSLFGADPIQAYPLVGLFVSAAKLVAKNKVDGKGITLTPSDRRSLRELTEEIFREVVTTTKWAGTGDSRLKEWLDRHFEPAPTSGSRPPEDLGNPKGITSTYKEIQWRKLLFDLEPTGQRNVDRRTASLQFWVQYLVDSKVQGALPRGPVEFDHIVAFEKAPRSITTHPLNIAAIREPLNHEKGIKSYKKWAPTGTIDQEYRMNVGCQLALPRLPGAASSNFLDWADHATVGKMIIGRQKVFQYVLGPLLREWISTGD